MKRQVGILVVAMLMSCGLWAQTAVPPVWVSAAAGGGHSLSPDSKYVVSWRGPYYSFWKARGSEPVKTRVLGALHTVVDCIWSSDQRYFAVRSSAGLVNVIDVQSMRLIYSNGSGLQDRFTLGLRFSKDNQRIYGYVSPGLVKFVDIQSAAVVESIDFPCLVNGSMAELDADEKLVFGSACDSAYRVYERKTSNLVHSFVHEGSQLGVCKYYPEQQRLITSDWQGRVRIWNSKSYELLDEFVDAPRQLASIELAKDADRCFLNMRSPYDSIPSRILCRSISKHSILWQQNLKGFTLSLSPNEQYLACRSLTTFFVMKSEDGTLSMQRDCATQSPSVSFGLNSKELYLNGTSQLLCFDVASKTQQCAYAGHKHNITGCALSPDETQLLTACQDSILRVYDVASGGLKHVVDTIASAYLSATYTPKGNKLITTSTDGLLRFWDASTFKALSEYDVYNAVGPSASKIRPDGKMFLTRSDTEHFIMQRDIETATTECAIIDFPYGIGDYGYSPDGKMIYSGTLDGVVKTWSSANCTKYDEFKGYSKYLSQVKLSADGFWLAVAGKDSSVYLWLSNSSLEHKLHAGSQPLQTCAFADDGTRILAAGPTSLPKLFSIEDERLLLSYKGDSTESLDLGQIYMSPNRKFFVVSNSSALYLWNVDNPALKAKLYVPRVVDLCFNSTSTMLYTTDIWLGLCAWDLRFLNTSSVEEHSEVTLQDISAHIENAELVISCGQDMHTIKGLRLFDILGRRLYSSSESFLLSASQLRIPIPGSLDLRNGVYFLQLETELGASCVSARKVE